MCYQLQEILDLSPTIPIEFLYRPNTVTLYARGAQLLDEGVVESNLIWLENFPQVAKPLAEALKIYLRKDSKQYRNMLDNLRFALEEMLRVVLKNSKSLENQKEEFLRWLKSHGAQSQIVNGYADLLFGRFARYQNDAVKHHEDEYTPAEVEFLLYWTGTLLRFIQRVSEQPLEGS